MVNEWKELQYGTSIVWKKSLILDIDTLDYTFLQFLPAYYKNGSNYASWYEDIVDTTQGIQPFTLNQGVGHITFVNSSLETTLLEDGHGFIPSFYGLLGDLLGKGDVVIDQNNNVNSDDNIDLGDSGFWLQIHELGHAVGGLKDVKDTILKNNLQFNSQKYTMMSYNHVNDVHASGLQLLDIKALQDTYGMQNTATRSGDTTYALGQGLGFANSTAINPFLYTIWDGGGEDTIDASGFSTLAHGTEIDLREGRFSSIGAKNINGDAWNVDSNAQTYDPDPGNVAIAYGTEIENAVGTNNDDNLIGNDLDNKLEGLNGDDILRGMAGNDQLFGGGGSDIFIGGAGNDFFYGGAGDDILDFNTGVITQASQTGITLNLSSSGTVTDEYGYTDTFSEIENFNLTLGKDTVYASLDDLNNIIDGRSGHDVYTNTNGILEIKGDEFWVWDENGNTRDILRSFQEVHVDKIVPSSIDNPAIATLIANDSTFNDLDFRDVTGALNISANSYNLNAHGNIVGNNEDNTFSASNVESPNFYTGLGDDTVSIGGSSNTGTSTGDIFYSGGNDSYHYDENSIINIILPENVVGSDVSLQSANHTGIDGGYNASLNIAGLGLIDIEYTGVYNGTNNFAPVVLTLDNGEFVVLNRQDPTITINTVTSGYPVQQHEDEYYHVNYDGGTWGVDTLNGDASDETLKGFGGKDTINGGGGVDTLYGGSGNDTLNGGSGNDTLYGSTGIDTLNGDEDNDTIHGGEDTDHIDGGSGTNTLYGDAGGDIFYVGTGIDTATGGEGSDTYIVESDAASSTSLTITDFDVSEDRIDLTAFGSAENFASLFISYYSAGGNIGAKFSVSDALNSIYEIDLVGVESGALTASNFAFGTGGTAFNYQLPLIPSTIVTADNIGTIIDESLATQALVINALGGDDTIYGAGFFGNYIYGGDGDDIIYDSNAVFYGGQGGDYFESNWGDDFYIVETDSNPGFDTIHDFQGTDVLVLEGSVTTSDVALSINGLDLEVSNNTYDWAVTINNTEGTPEDVIEYIVVQDVVYNLSDVYNTGVWTPYTSSTTVAPNAFDDLITIDRGGVITGSVFNDNGNGPDYDPDGIYLEVDPISDTGAYGSFDLLADGSFTFTGTQNHVGTKVFNYTLRDGDGETSTADITLNSVVTNEAPVAQNMDAIVSIEAGGALNFVPNFTDPDGDAITYSATLQDGSALPSYITVDPNNGTLTGTMPATSQATIGIRLIATDWMSQTTYDLDLDVYDTITGTAALDYLHGDAGTDIIYGGDGEDRLYGNDGNDELHGENDNDRIYGHLGNDTIYGDNGWDLLYGLQGDDIIYGGIGNDTIRGDDASALDTYVGAGNDEIHGGDGGDNIGGGAGDDLLYGDAGNDYIYGNSGDDTAYGGDNDDRLYGNAGDDELHGEAGIDRIYGHEGNDVIYGGADNDLLYGLQGSDIIYGGDGNDRVIGDDDPATAGFVDAGNDVLLGEGGNDVLGGGAGDDLLIGGTGVDALYGNTGADTFAYLLGDLDGSKDYIHDFSVTDGDVINIADVIDYSSVNGDAIADFVTIYNGGSYVRVIADQDGTGTAHTTLDVAQVQGNTGWDLNTLITNGTLIVE